MVCPLRCQPGHTSKDALCACSTWLQCCCNPCVGEAQPHWSIVHKSLNPLGRPLGVGGQAYLPPPYRGTLLLLQCCAGLCCQHGGDCWQ